MKTKLILVLTAAFALYCVISCSGSKEDIASKQPAPAAQQSATQAAAVTPTGSGIAFMAADTKGNSRNSNEWLGKKPVVLNFWGTWCPPCRRELPDLIKLYKEYAPKGVEIIGFGVKDTPLKVQMFANQAGMDWVMLMANDQVLNDYNVVNGIPTTIFLDKTGKEVGRFIGAREYSDFKPMFEQLLK